jgi:hypothetical protein
MIGPRQRMLESTSETTLRTLNYMGRSALRDDANTQDESQNQSGRPGSKSGIHLTELNRHIRLCVTGQVRF